MRIRLIIFTTALAAVITQSAEGRTILIDDDLEKIAIGNKIQYLEDSTNALNIHDIRQNKRWIDLDKINPGFGFTRSTYWIRFSVKNVSSRAMVFYLEQGYPLIDRICLYYPDVEGTYRVIKTGDTFPFSERPINHREFIFPLRLKAGKTSLYYMSFTTTSSMNLPLAIWKPDAFRESLLREDRMMMLFYGMMLMMIVYNLFVYFSVRHISYIYYVLFILFFLAFIMTQQGTAFQFLWPGFPWWANFCIPLILSLMVFFAVQFTRTFLLTDKNLNEMRIFFVVVSYACAAAVIFSLLAIIPVAYSFVMAGTAIFTALGIILAVYISIRLSLKKIRSAYFYSLSWASLLAGGALYLSKTFAILPTNFVTTWSILIGASLMIVLLSFAQSDKINTMRIELNVLSMGLEVKVRERTEELQSTMEEMEAINERLTETNCQLEEAKKNADIDMKMASNLQSSLLPKEPPSNGEWDIAVSYNPMKGVSGDLYDFYLNDKSLKGLSLFDVSGHGISSGLLTILAKSIIQRNFYRGKESRLNHVMETVNNEIIAEIKNVDNYLTGILLRISEDTIEYINAGHLDLFIRRSVRNSVIRIRPQNSSFSSNLLGIQGMEDRFDVIKFKVQKGDTLLLFSDGLPECRNRGNLSFGEERIIETFKNAPDSSAADIIDHIMNDFTLFMEGKPIDDDVTLMVLKRKV